MSATAPISFVSPPLGRIEENVLLHSDEAAGTAEAPRLRRVNWTHMRKISGSDTTRLLEHLVDNLRHVRRREGSQRLGANVAQGTEVQIKRRGGKLIRRIENCHNIIPSLRPE